MLDAPGLFSTSTETPRSAAIFSASKRVITSDPPPGEKGTIILIGLEGNSDADRFTAANNVNIPNMN